MTPERNEEFTRALTSSAEARSDVLGLVALGSMAALPDHPPDAWSDHDFFLLVAPGAQESYRNDLAWLPDPSRIALSFRETQHGLKVLYDDGHLLEFAVFDLEELHVARVNRYRVLLDRADLSRRMAELARRTREGTSTADPSWLAGQVMTGLVVSAGRTRRGESLSGRAVLMGAVRHLLVLGAKVLTSPDRGQLDDLDPHRRVERAFPDLGRALEAALRQDGLEAVTDLLDLVEQRFAPRLPAFTPRAIAAVRAALGRMG